MKLRKLLRCLVLGVFTGVMFVGGMPAAHAGDSGVIEDAGATTATDVVDFIKHATNSFRPSTSPYPSPFTTYQRACTPGSTAIAQMGGGGAVGPCLPFDIDSSQMTSNATAQTFTFKMTLLGSPPPRGAPVTAFPQPFNSIDYEWYFSTTTQEVEHAIGITCGGVPPTDNDDDFTVGNPPPSGPARTGVKVNYTAPGYPTCPSASTDAKEATGVADGSRAVTTRQDVLTPPHPATDGWLANVAVTSVEGQHGTPRLDGNGLLACQNNPATGQPWPRCVDYDLSIGIWEQMSSAGASNSRDDFDAITKPKMTYSVSGNVVTATIPWNPTNLSPDGDGLVDDRRSFPWVLGAPGAKVTQFIADTNGGMGVGVNLTPIQAICTDSEDNIVPEAPSPIKEVGAAIGTVNRAIGEGADDLWDTRVQPAYDSLPEPIDDDDSTDGQDVPPENDPHVRVDGGEDVGSVEVNGVWIFGTGDHEQGDCIRGTLTLGTLLDWTDNAFELRIYPRQPAYLASPSSTQCRFPIGSRNLVVVTLNGLTPPSVDPDTSPFDKPYNVQVFANSGTPLVTQAGPVAPNPAPVSPLAGQIGKNQPCNYTYHAPGMHYKDTLVDFFM